MKIIVISMIMVLILIANVGCISFGLSGQNSQGFPEQPEHVKNAPERAPTLSVSMKQENSPVQSFRAIQLTTSWLVTNEDGTGSGYSADSPHALQLGEDQFNTATLQVSGLAGVVEMQFSDDFPPDLISVQRWKAEYATGNQDISDVMGMEEAVDIIDTSFHFNSDGNDYIYEIYAQWSENGSSWYTFRINSDNSIERVDIGCCVLDIPVRETALLGANTVSHTNNDFVITLNSDKQVYSSTDIIKIWGTLEYIGDYDTIEIFSGCPFMIFAISGGNEYDFGDAMGGISIDILFESILERGRVYHFEYQKSGGWSESDPDAEFWEEFFSEEDLMLPEGEYTITLLGRFGLSEMTPESENGLKAELNIAVTR